MTSPKFTATKGPKGGVEFRQWTGLDTYRVVSKFTAWGHLSDADKAFADGIAENNRKAKQDKARNDAMWRDLMRGG